MILSGLDMKYYIFYVENLLVLLKKSYQLAGVSLKYHSSFFMFGSSYFFSKINIYLIMDLNFINLISDLLRVRTVFETVGWTYAYSLLLRKAQSMSVFLQAKSSLQVCMVFSGK